MDSTIPRCTDSTIPPLLISKPLSLLLSSVTVQAGLCQTWSEKPEDWFSPIAAQKEQFHHTMVVCVTSEKALNMPGVDLGFLERGFQIHQGGTFSTFYLIFHKFPHEIEIIWSQREVQVNPPNPL